MQRTTVWEGAARHEVHQQLPRIEEKEKKTSEKQSDDVDD